MVGSWGLSDAVLPGSLTFLAIGDWGRGGTGGQEVTAPPLAAWAAALTFTFAVLQPLGTALGLYATLVLWPLLAPALAWVPLLGQALCGATRPVRIRVSGEWGGAIVWGVGGCAAAAAAMRVRRW